MPHWLTRRNLALAVVGILTMLMLIVMLSLRGCAEKSGGNVSTASQTQATPTTPAPAQKPVQTTEPEPSRGLIVVLAILGLIALGVAAWLHYNPQVGARSVVPASWAFAVFLGIPLALWLLWGISPRVYQGVTSSNIFWPLFFATILIAYLASQNGVAARVASIVLTLLAVAAIIVGIYSAPGGGVPTVSLSATSPKTGVATPVIHEVTFGRQWSDWITVGYYSHIDWDRTDNVEYEVQNQDLMRFKSPRDPVPDTRTRCERLRLIEHSLYTVRFRVTDTEADRVTLKYRILSEAAGRDSLAGCPKTGPPIPPEKG